VPLGGVGISDKIREVINGVPPGKRWMHAFTYSGHPTCCAVALKNIEILEREKLTERADTLGASMLKKLKTLESLDGVGNVRGLGMMAAVEVVADKVTKQYFPPEVGLTQKLTDALLDRGLYTRVAMDFCIAPPLVTTDAQIDRLVSIIGETVAAVLKAETVKS
jgi:adenosylmethionine-8-amino-7-oxononanoate aminotransferase